MEIIYCCLIVYIQHFINHDILIKINEKGNIPLLIQFPVQNFNISIEKNFIHVSIRGLILWRIALEGMCQSLFVIKFVSPNFIVQVTFWF